MEQSQTLLRCIGDKHVVAAEKTNNVIIGNADDELTTSASNAVLIGHNADVKVDGGVTTSLFYKKILFYIIYKYYIYYVMLIFIL